MIRVKSYKYISLTLFAMYIVNDIVICYNYYE